jgi:hypothetical protein
MREFFFAALASLARFQGFGPFGTRPFWDAIQAVATVEAFARRKPAKKNRLVFENCAKPRKNSASDSRASFHPAP